MTATPVDIIRGYHERTKHRLDRYAAGPDTLDWDSQPDPFRQWLGARHYFLPRTAQTLAIPWDALAAAREPAPLDIGNLGSLLQLTSAVTAWKQYGDVRWPLRAHPSSGNLHPTETWLIAYWVEGLPDGLYHYQAKDHGVEWRAETLDASDAPGLWLGFSSIHWREAWKYGERALRYCQLDMGHVLAALAYAAALFGWRPRLVDMAPDQLARSLGLDRAEDFDSAEHEEAEVMIALHGDPAAPAPVPPTDWDEWNGLPSRLDPKPMYEWPVIEEAAIASRGPLPFLPSPASGGGAGGEGRPLSEPGSGLDLRLRGNEGIAASSVILQRRSAQAFDGVSVMPGAVFRRLLQSLLPGGSPVWSMWTAVPRVHPVLFVHRVEGIAPGLYILPRSEAGLTGLGEAMRREFEWAPADAGLPLYKLIGATAERTARTVSCHQDIAARCAVSFMFVAEFEVPVEANPAAWRHLHWEAGMLGHCLTLEAEAAGWRGTGIGCFFDDADHEILGLADASYQAVYHYAVGMAVDDPRLTTLPAYD